ncbi:hypothetical protein CDAR_113191 [Caerostris darwini]|uniref:Uncharacterized protein n=1 Tax=Caerostris darwini TaxID=1538125 RepID=A0AAV4Q1Q2_9ARAC|nr:hypothetical protein CDAR_113191 [Caerostris darwini]
MLKYHPSTFCASTLPNHCSVVAFPCECLNQLFLHFLAAAFGLPFGETEEKGRNKKKRKSWELLLEQHPKERGKKFLLRGSVNSGIAVIKEAVLCSGCPLGLRR